jgi:hypothetical protein
VSFVFHQKSANQEAKPTKSDEEEDPDYEDKDDADYSD